MDGAGESLARSEEMVARIVAHLAPYGVQRTTFGSKELGYESGNETRLLFIDAMNWLQNEGVVFSSEKIKFMNGTSEGEVYALRFVLTSKGYKLLSSRFNGDLTLGQAITKVNASGEGYANLGDLVGGLLGGFTKSMGSG
ncbi:hypothetical protein [Paracoccus homiensis]|uniref:hypothetical protein n=1 Tax=Paracoccus homiensis TaxID=364199 RepID=UPI000B89A390|nr:hypothetical protein [Paracoccus homiensis]